MITANTKSITNGQVQLVKDFAEAITTETEKYSSLVDPNWGHIGNLTHVLELLDEAYNFLMGQDN